MIPKISVVVPVFNAESCLNRCIDSILSQTFTDFELLLIDDGSDDGSSDICDKYVEVDKRVKFFHKLNGGVSSARNVGLKNSIGEWVTFVDSDDYLAPNFLYRFFLRISAEQFDLYFGNSAIVTIAGEYQYNKILKDVVCNVSDAVNIFSVNRQGDLHGKIFKKEILLRNGIYFNENVFYAEDGIFFDEYLVQIDKVAIDSQICYTYERVSSGISFRLNSFKSESICFHCYYNVIEKLSKKISKPISALFNCWIAERYIYSLFRDSTIKKFKIELEGLPDEKLRLIADAVKNKRMGCIMYEMIISRRFEIAWFFMNIVSFKIGFKRLFTGYFLHLHNFH